MLDKCTICNKTIKDIKKEENMLCNYYNKQALIKHLKEKHNLNIEEYLLQEYNIFPPLCKCGKCGQYTKIKISGSKLIFNEYRCGRYPGTILWSEKAKVSRLGKNNPAYKKEPWNKNKNKDNDEKVNNISIKLTGRKVEEKTKNKQSESAKKRLIHGHTGKKHSEKTILYLRENTLKMIKEGKYNHMNTLPNREFEKFLIELNIPYEKEYILDKWSFDFFIQDNIFIEIDGDYYHSNPIIYTNGPVTKTQKRNKYRDKIKNDYCIKNNIILYRFWESDILKNKEQVKCKLKELFQLKK